MEPVSVSYFHPATSNVVTHDGMKIVRIIIIMFKNLWGTIRGGQCTNIVYRGNIYGS